RRRRARRSCDGRRELVAERRRRRHRPGRPRDRRGRRARRASRRRARGRIPSERRAAGGRGRPSSADRLDRRHRRGAERLPRLALTAAGRCRGAVTRIVVMRRVHQSVSSTPRLLRAGFLATLLAAAATACVTHEPLSEQYVGPQALPASVAQRYEYRAGEALPDPEPWRRRPRFVVHELELPGADGTPVAIEYYAHDEGDGPMPVVMVLPIFDGQP